MSLHGAELRGIYSVALYRNGGSFERKFIIPSGLIHDLFKCSLILAGVEIISPGRLPNSLTVEEVKYGNPVIRNNQIALFASRTLPYSGPGSGLRRAFKNQPNMELVNDVEGEQFIARFPRKDNDISCMELKNNG